jgi:hypothetical protein
MLDAGQLVGSFHTKVCMMEGHLLGSYRQLIAHEIECRKLTITALAKETGYNRRSLKRMITGAQELRARDIIAICAAIGVDRMVATFAIECMGNWQFYYDVTLQVTLSLIKPVVNRINESATAAIEPLTNAAQKQLASWIADIVIRNQEQIYDRRDRLTDLPRL